MGIHSSNDNPKNKKLLTLACLNYSGIQDSPYEFYEYETANEKKLNSIFENICNIYVDGFRDPNFKWIMGKIDKEWHTRYSPLYDPKCGIKPNRELMSIQEFEDQWDAIAEKEFSKFEWAIYDKMSQKQREQVKGKELAQCKIFDSAVYKSLLQMIYGIESFEQVKVNPEPYINFQASQFKKNFLNAKMKQSKTLETLRKNQTDIFFLQEANLQLIEQIGQKFPEFYCVNRIYTNCTSAIFLRKCKFAEIKDFRQANQLFLREYYKRTKANPEKDLFWNNDTVFQVLSRHILISAHLSSKKEKNSGQIQQMKASITKLKQFFPEYEVIIGGNINGPLEFGFQIPINKLPLSVHVYPNANKDTTVNKKRTLMQAQETKANKYSHEVKDYVISTLPLSNCRVTTVNGSKVSKSQQMPLLPNSEHPYDHYLITATVEI